ncbi:MAG: ribonuclease T2 [Pseudomonadota bacterium]
MWRVWSILALLWAGVAAAQDRAGAFDYYVLALSWTPSWCAIEGDARGSDQCDARHDHGFTLHGLWPQYETGYPQDCRSAERDPSRRQTGAMTDIMGSGGLAWHQWKKHGRCAGVSAQDYFDLSRAAYDSITRPEILRQIDQDMRLSPKVVEAAFLEVNPALLPSGVTVTCRDGRIQEVRICLTKSLEPRICGRDVQRDCSAQSALFSPIR